ncbi:MAG: hypothetical protein IJZ22_04425 [Bacteroidaceae bacterium]|nr:hypothetical protein [Bacteroidaceae bacterium]
MAEINKISLNGNNYDIVPKLGTGLIAEDGVVGINFGGGVTFDKSGKVTIKFGTGLICSESNGEIAVNFGTAQVTDDSSADCGIAINDSGFVINPVNFKKYLVSLGVQFTQV